MKAIRVHELGGADVLRFEDVAEPAPAAGELLVRMDAVGVNFIEVYFRKGLYKASLPFTPGTEGAGTVEATGANVRDFRVGDRVASTNFTGAYAERALVKADRAVRVPDDVDPRTAAAAMLQGMTAHYLTTSTFALQRDHRCLVHAAAGGVGLLLCQMARRIGAFVIGTVSTPEKAELARAAGANEVILYTERDFLEEVRRITDGRMLHVVYDSVGATTFARSLDCLVPRGMLALFGQSSGPVPPFDPILLSQKGSLYLTRPTLSHYVATREELEWRAKDVLEGVRSATLDVRVGAAFPLSNAGDAHRALEGRGTTGKVLLLP